jgi:hypothetical protein
MKQRIASDDLIIIEQEMYIKKEFIEHDQNDLAHKAFCT